ncbi:MAG: hypothetical protein U9M89_02700 [Patescibacteria group bacterium]|nr:hypothetical protein [Patescibacteria group bacterium]
MDILKKHALEIIAVLLLIIIWVSLTNLASAQFTSGTMNTGNNLTTEDSWFSGELFEQINSIAPDTLDDEDEEYYCNICSGTSSNGGETAWSCVSSKFAYECEDVCQSASDCEGKRGGGDSDEEDGTDPDGSNPDDNPGDNDGGSPEPDDPFNNTHWECGSGNNCIEIEGEGTDQCTKHSDCGGESPGNDGGGGEVVPPDYRETHFVCQGQSCTEVEGGGHDQCITHQDCEALNDGDGPSGFSSPSPVMQTIQNIVKPIGNFFVGIWTAIKSFFKR